MSLMNLDTLRATPLEREPFEYLVVPGFLTPDSADVVDRELARHRMSARIKRLVPFA